MKPTFAFGLTLAALFASPEFAQADDCGSCSGCLWTFPTGTQCFPDAFKETCKTWGSSYEWCGNGSVTEPTEQPTTAPMVKPTSKPTVKPTDAPTPVDAARPSSLLYGPYIDMGMGSASTIVKRMDAAGLNVITLAFARGVCAQEEWAGQTPSSVASLTKTLAKAKKKYIISSGGAAGAFTCPSDVDFLAFIKRYSSEYLVGIDFDIEVGQSKDEIDQLVRRAKHAQEAHPNLRFSFTIATFGRSEDSNGLNETGQSIMASLKKNELSNYYINLMAMDYGDVKRCVVKGDVCDMGASAVQAAKDLNSFYSVPFSQIELTPMIGGNDVVSNVFTMEDVTVVSDFVKTNGLAGVHFWSLDRDEDCEPGAAKASCNTYGKAGSLGFSKAFAAALA